MVHETPGGTHPDQELDRRSSAFADGLNCLGIVLCAHGLSFIREKYGVTDVRQTLVGSAEACLDFLDWLVAHASKSEPGLDLKAAEEAFAELRSLLDEPQALEPRGIDSLRRAIRRASAAFGIELSAHPMATRGAVCEHHDDVCPPPELAWKKGRG